MKGTLTHTHKLFRIMFQVKMWFQNQSIVNKLFVYHIAKDDDSPNMEHFYERLQMPNFYRITPLMQKLFLFNF